MSDGGVSWQPPTPGGFGPPTAPVPQVTPEPAPPRSRSRGKVIAAGVGAVAIIAAGTFAVTRISADSSSGGAASPEDAGMALLDAIDDEDVLAMADLLLPGERTTLRDPAVDLVDELRRLEVLSDGASLSKIDGIDLVVTDRSVAAVPTNVEDIVNVRIGAAVAGSVDGEQLPIGDWIRDATDTDFSEIQEDAEAPDPAEFEITTVEAGGRWYLSLFYTAAEAMRKSAGSPDIPAEGVTPHGGDEPEGAIDAILDGVEAGDLEPIIAALDPNELQALQRYAPLFLDDAQAAIDEAVGDVSDLDYSISDREYRVEGDGDRRSVFVEGFTVTVSAEGETATASFHDGCLVAEADGESIDSCDVLGETPDLGDIFEDPQPVEDLLASIEDTFADYEAPGIIVSRVDGEWYLSPMATVSDNVLAVIRSLSRDEIEALQDKITNAVDVFDELVVDIEQDLPQLDDFELPGGDDTVVEEPTDDSVAPDPAEDCYVVDDPAEAASCFQELVDSGAIEPAAMPFFLRFPDCGLADSMWSGDYYALPDDEFVALVEEAAPCFQAHVTAGDIEDYDLPYEIADPQCLAGRNRYAATDDDYLDTFDDCVFG